MRSGIGALVVTLLVLAPSVAAAPDAPDAGTIAKEAPCLHVDVTTRDPGTGEAHRVEGTYPLGACEGRQVNFTWDEDLAGGWGTVDLRAHVVVHVPSPMGCVPGEPRMWYKPRECPYPIPYKPMSAGAVRLVDASLLGALRTWMGGGARPEAPPVPAAPLRFDAPKEVSESAAVGARFRVAWAPAGDCADARGEVAAFVDGASVATDAPSGFFAALCQLSRTHAPALPDVATQAARLAALALGTVQRGFPPVSPVLDPVRAGLDDLAAPTLPADLPEPPTAPSSVVPSAAEGEAVAARALAQGSAEVEWAVGADAGLHASTEGRLAVGALPAPSPLPTVGGSPSRAADPAPPADDGARRVSIAPLSEPASPPASSPPDPPSRAVAPSVTVAGTTPRPADAADAGRAVAGALALLVLVALYQRLTRPAALDQPLRARVHAACVVRGGWATAREIGEAVGVGRTTAEYHLVYLARLGLLQAARVTPRRRVFAPRAAAAAASEAGEPLPDQVLGLVRARAEVPLSAIARELRLTRTRADRCVKDLLLEGRLASRWEDGARLYSLPQRG